jgi:anti-anti-sigma factor
MMSGSMGHRLHETRIEGRGVDPAGAYGVEVVGNADGVVVLALTGELDMAAAPAVRARVDEVAGGRGVVLDLTEVTFVDSSMLRELLRAGAELARYETTLVLAAVPVAVRRLFDLTRTAEMFTIAADRDSAVELAKAS